MVTLSLDQFDQLLSVLTQSSDKCGSFSGCSFRYNGERNPAKLEEFIAEILTYKIVEKIDNTSAVNGMHMLLEGDAAEWWHGAKAKATTFNDIVRMLREAFAPLKPAWRVYAEINEVKQHINEPTDTFIRKKRALFSQLSKCPSESEQIDMLFGMLHAQIRDRISRGTIQSFEDLLSEAREAEQVINERGSASTDVAAVASGRKRCSFCRKKGHTVETCFKKEEAIAKLLPVNTDAVVKPIFACYGCNTPGFVRSNCPKCSKKKHSDSPPVSIYFNFLGLCVGRDIPTVNVELFGVPGQAYFDTGAKKSIASSKFKQIMEFKGCKFDTIDCKTSLADGSSSITKFLKTTCRMVIGGRSLYIDFLVFADAKNNRTLIGTDFLEKAGIVLNMGQQYWYYENCPTQVFDFADSQPLDLNLLGTIQDAKTYPKRKPADVAAMGEEPKFITPKRHRGTCVSEFESYGSDNDRESNQKEG